MKNIKTLTAVLAAIAMWSCDPLADDIDEINEKFVYTNDVVFTMSDDDYETADDTCDCSGFGNFSSLDGAKIGIAAVLGENYPALGETSSAIVTYDFYNGSSPDLRGTFTEVTVPDGDYDLINGFDGFDNFGNADADVVEWVNWKGYEGEDGDYIDVTFDYYDGSFHGGEVSRIVYSVAYGWQYAWIISQEVYDFFGESSTEFPDGSGNYTPDFSYDDEASEKMHIYLNEFMTLFRESGDILVVQFNYDNGADNEIENPTEQDVLLYIFDGSGWLLYGDSFQVTSEVLSFGHNGEIWVADNTIKLILTGDDYAAIAAAYATTNEAGSGSMDNFGNYDLGLWSSDQIFESITSRLLEADGIVKEDGQKYVVTYATWEPGAGSGTVSVIYSATESTFIAQ